MYQDPNQPQNPNLQSHPNNFNPGIQSNHNNFNTGYQPPNNFNPGMQPSNPNQPGHHNTTSSQSIYVSCMNCGQRGYTRVSRSLSTGGIVLLIILIILFFPAALLVLCIDSCYETKHYCSHCGNIVSRT